MAAIALGPQSATTPADSRVTGYLPSSSTSLLPPPRHIPPVQAVYPRGIDRVVRNSVPMRSVSSQSCQSLPFFVVRIEDSHIYSLHLTPVSRVFVTFSPLRVFVVFIFAAC